MIGDRPLIGVINVAAPPFAPRTRMHSRASMTSLASIANPRAICAMRAPLAVPKNSALYRVARIDDSGDSDESWILSKPMNTERRRSAAT